MTVESALLKQLLSHGDFETWNRLKQHYLPEGEYQKLWKIVDKHVHKFQAMPSFEDLKFEVRSRELQEKIYAIEAVDTEVPAYELLEYLKDQFTQSEILSKIETYLDDTISIADAKENIDHLQEIVVAVQDRVDTTKDNDPMDEVELFDSEEDLARRIGLGLNQDYDISYTFSPKDLVIVGAQRGMGKTFTCCNIALNAHVNGRSSLYFTIEMDSRQILQRMAAVACEVPLKKIISREGLYQKDYNKLGEWWADRFEGGKELLSQYNLYDDFDKFHFDLIKSCKLKDEGQLDIHYDPGLTLAKIISTVRQKKIEYPDLGLVVVDYLNQVRRHNAPSRSGQYEWTEQIEISKGLKSLAQDQEVLVVSAFQTNPKGEVRFSKGIEDAVDASYVIEHWGRNEDCIAFRCKKMRSNEQRGFVSTIDWDTLKIGPHTAIDPDTVAEMKKDMKTGEDTYDL